MIDFEQVNVSWVGSTIVFHGFGMLQKHFEDLYDGGFFAKIVNG